jgi:hypothetical protein
MANPQNNNQQNNRPQHQHNPQTQNSPSTGTAQSPADNSTPQVNLTQEPVQSKQAVDETLDIKAVICLVVEHAVRRSGHTENYMRELIKELPESEHEYIQNNFIEVRDTVQRVRGASDALLAELGRMAR